MPLIGDAQPLGSRSFGLASRLRARRGRLADHHAGPLLGDSDGDGIDDRFDNCTSLANPSQLDADGDGCGNACDCDFNQTGVCVISDFLIMKACLGKNVPASILPPPPAGPTGLGGFNEDPTCAESDMDGSTVVTVSDFNLLRLGFGKFPGPSESPLRDTNVCP